MTHLPPEDPEAFDKWVQGLPEEERARLASQSVVVAGAREFVDKVWSQRDLKSGWPLVDPLLRECLIQNWLHPNRADVVADGWDIDEVVEALKLDQPEHALWQHFERVQIRGLFGWGDPTGWPIGTNTRLFGPDMETVVFFPPGTTVFAAGASAMVLQMLMRFDSSAGWRVVNLYDALPESGWPPRLAPEGGTPWIGRE